ncbi:tumor necrosis factor ligand superfamily member 14-like isoform X2 [Salarias fasciatus]|uniref:Tumor necrosis factor ligand superfamily member 14-like n=1 Tax=Salarias fasciatus TaxID=181472 RepID=A0A672HJ93_SALFA|nr:tumor necrosis factor ligand superfamily member 14-like isoform X2 [Salarias fasciatus]
MSAPATFNLSTLGEVKPGGAPEAGAAACPQVFMVDSQASYISMPKQRKPRTTTAHRLLLLLVGLALLGLLLEGYFIYKLYQRIEPFSPSICHPACQNQSNHATSGQQTGSTMSQVGLKDLNQINMQKRAFAHLIGAKNHTLENNVVQWVKEGEAFIHNMNYGKDGLVVQKEGYYYIYSKVQVNAAEDCLLIQHKVIRVTKAYDLPIELMKSKSFRCRTPKPSNAKPSTSDDLWNNYLGGIFHVHGGDRIIVELESKQSVQLHSGLSENFMGAFMISPWKNN